MLEDVPGLINPIIQSMIATNRSQQETADRAQRAEVLKNEATYKQAELKHQDAVLAETQREHDMMMEHNRRMLEDVHIPQLQAMLEHQGLENLATKTGLAKQGVQGLQGPPGVAIPDQATQLANEVAAIKQRAGAQTQGQMEAQQPFLDKAAERARQTELEKLLQEHRNRTEEQIQAGANAIEVAKTHGQYQLAGDRLNGINHLKGIILGMGGDEAGGNMASQLVNDIYSGQRSYKDLNTKEKMLVDKYTTGTGETIPTNGVAYKGALDRVKSMQELLSQARDLANNYSRDTKGGTLISELTHGLAAGVVPGTDLASKLDSFKAFGGKLVTELEGMKRSSDADILRQSLGAFDPKATRKQNLDKINDRAKAMQTVLHNDVAGLPTDRVAKTLGDMGITDFAPQPTAYKQTATNPQTGHKIGSNDGGQTWFDIQTNTKVK